MDQQLKHIFQNEDAWMAEAQQRYVGDREFMDLKPALLPQDKMSVVIRRRMARLLEEQQTSVVEVK
jgi:hypothetical protein